MNDPVNDPSETERHMLPAVVIIGLRLIPGLIVSLLGMLVVLGYLK